MTARKSLGFRTCKCFTRKPRQNGRAAFPVRVGESLASTAAHVHACVLPCLCTAVLEHCLLVPRCGCEALMHDQDDRRFVVLCFPFCVHCGCAPPSLRFVPRLASAVEHGHRWRVILHLHQLEGAPTVLVRGTVSTVHARLLAVNLCCRA